MSRAVARGVTQVVVLGAGYDGRALRFAHPAVTFFEVDRAATQADKRGRLRAIGADASRVAFVTADLVGDDVTAALPAHGFEPTRPAVLTCEGLLPYLEPDDGARLLASCRTVAAAGSTLACNFHVRPRTNALDARLARAGADAVLRVIGERRRTQFRPGDPEALLARTGWRVDTVDVADRERHDYAQFVTASPA